jgi:hypothetical protein
MKIKKWLKSAGNGKPRTMRILIPIEQALEELQKAYHGRSKDDILKYLKRGVRLSNGFGNFYEITRRD